MKTVGDLMDAVKGFVFNNSNYLDLFQGTSSGVDVENKLDQSLMVAANNARLWAEKNHDFACSQVSVPTLLGGGLVVDLQHVEHDDQCWRLKKLVGVDFVCDDGGLEPLVVTTKRDLNIKQRWMDKLVVRGNALLPRVVVQGMKMKMVPDPSQQFAVEIDGYWWMDEYRDLNQSDWILENGFDFMMWQCILELNHIVQIFVPRNEGSLPPPERLKQAAWDSLVLVDSDFVNGGIWHE
jgi:hypothetical protein